MESEDVEAGGLESRIWTALLSVPSAERAGVLGYRWAQKAQATHRLYFSLASQFTAATGAFGEP